MPRHPGIYRTFKLRRVEFTKISIESNSIENDVIILFHSVPKERLKGKIQRKIGKDWLILNVSEPVITEVTKYMGEDKFFDLAETINQ